MKLSYPLAAAFAALLSLTACGGGSGDAGSGNGGLQNAVVKKTDISIGTGTEAVNGSRVQVNYTGWLYSATAANNKGTQFDTNTATGGKPFVFVIGATNTSESAIPGFGQGVQGMKVGGKRTIVIPAVLAYGSAGAVSNTGVVVVPPNTDIVFDVELLKVCGASC
jgi:FKBP-type peptidyl-prolyl cis-trans isomerase FkpA